MKYSIAATRWIALAPLVLSALALSALAMAPQAAAQPGPAQIAVAETELGRLAPTTELRGTVRFKEVAALASETAGKVIEVLFEEGDRLEEGAPMVRLDYQLLSAELAQARAMLARSRSELEQQRTRLERAEVLVRDEITTGQEFDDIRLTAESLVHQVEASEAAVEELKITIEKKTVRAPFAGVVVARDTEAGEWKSEGAAVAVYARDDFFDVMVPLPERQLPYVEVGAPVEVRILSETLEGEIAPSPPQGDVATRTFPIKVRIQGAEWLRDGMSASVRMPNGIEQDCVMVPRDALLQSEGRDTIVAVEDGRGVHIEVEVLGYSGNMAGIAGEGVEPGLEVAVKGQERVRDGQEVTVAGSGA